MEGDGGHGRGCIVTDTLQGAYLLVVVREAATMLVHHKLRREVHVAGARVVAQSLPHFQHLFDGCFGQRLDCGEVFNKAQIVVPPLVDAGLLQDDFRYPNLIGIALAAPGQVTLVLLVPLAE